MVWLAGIDEAGYGPTLGPLVLSLASIEASPDVLRPGSEPRELWDLLKPAIGRKVTKTARRLPVDDSKNLYSSGQGLGRLEESVLGCVAAIHGSVPRDLDQLLEWTSLESASAYDSIPWYRDRAIELPVEGDPVRIERYRAALTRVLDETVTKLALVCHPVSEQRLNRGIEETGNKAEALLRELVHLVRVRRPRTGEKDIRVDRLGGRIYYTEPLEEAFPDCDVHCVKEGSAHSVYRVDGLFERMRFEFRMKGDRHELLIAMASMLAKYVRELFMQAFNRFWADQVDGEIRPTAGYPVDARRFLDRIRSDARRLGIADEVLVRAR